MKNENKKKCDLILVDGGQNQIIAAKNVIDYLELDIPVFGLYKDDKHQTKGVMDKEGITYSFKNESIFFMLTRMQDEVHRFAISFHKQLRNKKMTKSILDDIPGLGRKRKDILIKAFDDINAIKNASLEELKQYIPESVAILLIEKLNK